MTNEEVLLKFTEWAKHRIADCESMPVLSPMQAANNTAKAGAYRASILNLARIIKEGK